ncbi:DUF6931 family protein [Polymorphobacter fuscus]|uniref:DUF6931 family protein n=1 Tax=Sandarakinorhabdus fusca TaxID=1439888 RepID=UPI0012978846|nr:hypothetical protein [Polymorphobacter fuscus]NJC07951.1 hypothetical protein [Polymorphobacter fuscus]
MATSAIAAPWRRVKWTRAGQLAGPAQVEAALAGWQDAPPAAAFAMLRAADPQAALRFLAHSLPRFDAVRWLRECLALTPAPADGSARAELRGGIAAWLADPSDKRRRLVFEQAQRAGFDVPEGAAGVAVFLSGGALGPAELAQGAPPAPGAFGQAVAAAVLLASLAQGSQRLAVQIDAMLALGQSIAETEESH